MNVDRGPFVVVVVVVVVVVSVVGSTISTGLVMVVVVAKSPVTAVMTGCVEASDGVAVGIRILSALLVSSTTTLTSSSPAEKHQ